VKARILEERLFPFNKATSRFESGNERQLGTCP